MLSKNMFKTKKKIESKKVVAGSISIVILSLLFLAGPVQAFVLGLSSVGDSSVERGENLTFMVSVDIENVDKFLPVKNLSLVTVEALPSIVADVCIFDVDGNILSGCEGMQIFPVRVSYSSAFGYGYGYGYSYGYGYDFGYDYGYDNGYSYGYGSGYGKARLEYRVVLDSGSYDVGNYSNYLKVRIGDKVFSKDGVEFEIRSGSSGVVSKKEDSEEPKEPKKYSKYYSAFVAPSIDLNASAEDDGVNESSEGDGMGVSGDESPRSGIGSFLSGITGGVIGTLGNGGVAGVGLFFMIVLGGIGFVRFRK